MRLRSPLVCPLSVLSNWEKQLADHVVEGELSCYSYHGASKGVKPSTLAKYDVSCSPDES